MKDVRIEELEQENTELLHENNNLLHKAERLAEEILSVRGQIQARMYLMIAAVVIVGRAALFRWEPYMLKLYLDIGFASLFLVLIGMWIWTGWRELHWMLIPYCVVLVDAGFLTVFYPLAIYGLLAAVLFCGTHTWEVLLSRMLVFLERLYDRKRKN